MGRRACPRASAGTPRLPLLAADLPARMAPQPPPQQPPQLRTLRARWMIGRPLLFSWRAADAGMTASARIPLARPLPRTSTWWASGPLPNKWDMWGARSRGCAAHRQWDAQPRPEVLPPRAHAMLTQRGTLARSAASSAGAAPASRLRELLEPPGAIAGPGRDRVARGGFC